MELKKHGINSIGDDIKIAKSSRGGSIYLFRELYPHSAWHLDCRWGLPSALWKRQANMRVSPSCQIYGPVVQTQPAGSYEKAWRQHVMAMPASDSLIGSSVRDGEEAMDDNDDDKKSDDKCDDDNGDDSYSSTGSDDKKSDGKSDENNDDDSHSSTGSDDKKPDAKGDVLQGRVAALHAKHRDRIMRHSIDM